MGEAEIEIFQNTEAVAFDKYDEESIIKYAYMSHRQFSSSEPTFANIFINLDKLIDETSIVGIFATTKEFFSVHLDSN